MTATWTQEEAIELCRQVEAICPPRQVEAICPPLGCHVALTGGCLYKDGQRKDVDLLFYRIRETAHLDLEPLFTALEALGVVRIAPPLSGPHWLVRAQKDGRRVDCLFPDFMGEYP